MAARLALALVITICLLVLAALGRRRLAPGREHNALSVVMVLLGFGAVFLVCFAGGFLVHKLRSGAELHGTFLLASATTAFCHPERSRNASTQEEILSCRRCAVMTADLALDQQRAQVGVAPLGDATQVVLAAARALARRQSDPGPELCAVLELLEVAHRGDHRRGR